jgi:hypothetical protein
MSKPCLATLNTVDPINRKETTMKRNLLLAAMALCAGVVSAAPAAHLERSIEGTATSGEPVFLTDGKCRYVGELIRHDPKPNFKADFLQIAGADAGRWRIDITQKQCVDVTSKVAFHIDLPTPPSLTGDVGIPREPLGYKAGTRFDLVAN